MNIRQAIQEVKKMPQSKFIKDKDAIILRCYNSEMRAREEDNLSQS